MKILLKNFTIVRSEAFGTRAIYDIGKYGLKSSREIVLSVKSGNPKVISNNACMLKFMVEDRLTEAGFEFEILDEENRMKEILDDMICSDEWLFEASMLSMRERLERITQLAKEGLSIIENT